MSQVKKDTSRLGGPYMIQDRDHTVDANQSGTGDFRQADQSQSGARQQGGDHAASRQQGSGDQTRAQQGTRRRQTH